MLKYADTYQIISRNIPKFVDREVIMTVEENSFNLRELLKEKIDCSINTFGMDVSEHGPCINISVQDKVHILVLLREYVLTIVLDSNTFTIKRFNKQSIATLVDEIADIIKPKKEVRHIKEEVKPKKEINELKKRISDLEKTVEELGKKNRNEDVLLKLEEIKKSLM